MKFHSLVRHPLFYDFNLKRETIRLELGYTPLQFQRTLNNALQEGLAWYKGTTLHFWSYNQDRNKLKSVKKDDYVYTKDVDQFYILSVYHNYYHKQTAKIYTKEGKQAKASNNISSFEHQKSFAPQSKFKVNKDITLSARKAAQLLNLNSPASGARIKKKLQEAGFIDIKANRVEINKAEALIHKAAGKHNVRYDKHTGKYWFVLADTFELKFRLRKNFKAENITTKGIRKLAAYHQSIHF